MQRLGRVTDNQVYTCHKTVTLEKTSTNTENRYDKNELARGPEIARFSNARRDVWAHCLRCWFSASLKLPPSSCSIKSSGSFWSDACKTAKGKPVQTLLGAAYASSCATVMAARVLLLVH